MSYERQAISLPNLIAEDLIPEYVSSSSDESNGSDDVFDTFDERNEIEFFSIMKQRKSDDINECFGEDILTSSTSNYNSASATSALETAYLDIPEDCEHFEFLRGSTNASEPELLEVLPQNAMELKKDPEKKKKELYISLAELEKLSLEENDAEFEECAEIFKLKTWNHVSLWKWDVDCDICAICRVVVTEPCLKCQSSGKGADECAVVWGECNHSYHNCCMSRWVATTPRCPLCQQTWVVQRIGT